MPTETTHEEESKDLFFQKLETLAREMIDTHDKDFAMGALILTARWIAEDKIAKIAQAS